MSRTKQSVGQAPLNTGEGADWSDSLFADCAADLRRFGEPAILSTDDGDATEDYDDPFSGPAFGLPFLERVLLAIIRGNPPSSNRSQSERQRLDSAMKALVDRKSAPVPLPNDLEDRALSIMARIDMERRYANSPRLSFRQLAIQSAKKVYPRDSAEEHTNRVERLRKVYTGAYNKNNLRTAGVQYSSKTHQYREEQHDYVRDSIEMQNLKKVAEIFSYFEVRLSLDD